MSTHIYKKYLIWGIPSYVKKIIYLHQQVFHPPLCSLEGQKMTRVMARAAGKNELNFPSKTG